MADTTEENTHWVSVWVSNDADYYFDALELASTDVGKMAGFIRYSLRHAPRNSSAWHTAREMSAADYDTVDWQEIADTLTAE